MLAGTPPGAPDITPKFGVRESVMASIHVPNFVSKTCLTPDDLEALRTIYPPKRADDEMGYNTSAESRSCEFDSTTADKIFVYVYLSMPAILLVVILLVAMCELCWRKFLRERALRHQESTELSKAEY